MNTAFQNTRDETIERERRGCLLALVLIAAAFLVTVALLIAGGKLAFDFLHAMR